MLPLAWWNSTTISLRIFLYPWFTSRHFVKSIRLQHDHAFQQHISENETTRRFIREDITKCEAVSTSILHLNILFQSIQYLLYSDDRIQQSDVKFLTRIRVRRQLEKVNQVMQRAMFFQYSFLNSSTAVESQYDILKQYEAESSRRSGQVSFWLHGIGSVAVILLRYSKFYPSILVWVFPFSCWSNCSHIRFHLFSQISRGLQPWLIVFSSP